MDYTSYLPSPASWLRLLMHALNNTVLAHRYVKSRRMLAMEEYDIDAATGFFPAEPLPPLTGQFGFWENARAKGEAWRARIRSFPILDIECLEDDDRLHKRAHMVLAFLINFYVHSQPPRAADEQMHVPACLAIPIVGVSRILGIAPVLTFADVVLWNWTPINPALPLSANNFQCMHTFTATETEKNFYLTSAKAEIRGVELLRIIDSYVHAPDITDFSFVSRTAKDLARLAAVVQDLMEIMTSVRETVDPYTFYWEVRPWWNGSDPKEGGWIYDGVPDSEKLPLSGPSAGQSTVMHALDVFLDVDHKLQQKRSPAPSEGNKKSDKGFMERMRLAIRDLSKDTPLLREPFDAVVLALKKFRDAHIRIASLYIITMANSTPPSTSEAKGGNASQTKKGPAKGTGGNELSVLLKAGRDATTRTMLSGNS